MTTPLIKSVVCAGAILVKNNRFLLGKRSINKNWAPGKWDIVGGKSLKHEHPLITLYRETMEETGIQVANADLLSTIEVSDDTTGKLDFLYHIFMVTHFKGKAINLSNEHSKLKWFTREELAQLPLALPAYVKIIDGWLENR